ncbi:hypothetical protein [Azospirillum sp. sgz301742]
MGDLPKIPRTTRRALLAGGAALAVGAPVLAATTAEDEPDAPMLRDCLAYLDTYMEVEGLADELDAVHAVLGDAGGKDHPDVVAAWRRVDEATDRASDQINRLADAEATTIVGVFAKAVGVGRFHLVPDDSDSDALHALLELMDDVVRLVRPSAGPLVRQILAHPALEDVLGEEGA